MAISQSTDELAGGARCDAAHGAARALRRRRDRDLQYRRRHGERRAEAGADRSASPSGVGVGAGDREHGGRREPPLLMGSHSERSAAYAALEATQDVELAAASVEPLCAILGSPASETDAAVPAGDARASRAARPASCSLRSDRCDATRRAGELAQQAGCAGHVGGGREGGREERQGGGRVRSSRRRRCSRARLSASSRWPPPAP